MQNLNPFSRKTIPYDRISKEFSENDGGSGGQSSSSDPFLAQKEKHEDEDDFLRFKHLLRLRSLRLRHACSYLFVALLSLLVGLILGQFFGLENDIDGYLTPYGSTHRNIRDVVWWENKTFTAEPSEESEKAWMSVIPIGRGFIDHPVLAPKQMKCVSVFHELHCLHGIRSAYFRNTYMLSKTRHQLAHLFPSSRSPLNAPNDHPHMPPTPFVSNPYLEEVLKHLPPAHLNAEHINHCFDYIRQALMCAADSNLEDLEIDPSDGELGADGWGIKRTCRNFKAVFEWSEKWRSGDSDGIA
ncbi:hypothetical protein EJ02DRAFT_378558 [Clathrospora elynae]|uniref:Uncharacterized protein n=1 Tax=Clathrospora elynae TaxID=706981 RepID=A0A6A5SKA5_9PLEO|nr:hypothetical protein EJ02DRAFT_378558 [Clathrospora elynae]